MIKWLTLSPLRLSMTTKSCLSLQNFLGPPEAFGSSSWNSIPAAGRVEELSDDDVIVIQQVAADKQFLLIGIGERLLLDLGLEIADRGRLAVEAADEEGVLGELGADFHLHGVSAK